ncbi:hypothetical protein [Rhodobacter capsulatus]|nr:hypothetical protein [Rhodobacter capsulatus]
MTGRCVFYSEKKSTEKAGKEAPTGEVQIAQQNKKTKKTRKRDVKREEKGKKKEKGRGEKKEGASWRTSKKKQKRKRHIARCPWKEEKRRWCGLT